MSDNPTVIHYASKAPPWFARRRTRRVLFLLVLLSASAIVLHKVCQPFVEQFSHVRTQHRLAQDFLPSGTVVFTEDASLVARLDKQAHYAPYVVHGVSEIPESRQYLNPVYLPSTNGNLLHSHFRGMRRTPSGQPMMVALGVAVFPKEPRGRDVCITSDVLTLASWLPGSRGSAQPHANFPIELGAKDRLTLFAGQPDARDPSRLTIDYQLNGRPGVIDGWLNERGQVELSIRSGSARISTPPPSVTTAR